MNGKASINGGPAVPAMLRVSREQFVERTNLPQPDPNWTHVDSNGHFHAHSTDERDRTPTLITRTEHRDCDGSCGGICEDEGFVAPLAACCVPHVA